MQKSLQEKHAKNKKLRLLLNILEGSDTFK